MTNFTRIAATAFAFSLVLFSCKKGDNKKLEPDNKTVADYMSTKQGSWWMYGSNDGTITKRIATGRDSFKLGRVYNYYETRDTVSLYVTPEYFAKNGDKLILLLDMDGNQTDYMEVVVQKDNPQVGDTWSNTGNITYSGLPFNLLTEGEVTSTTSTITLAGQTFTDVVETINHLKAKPALAPSYVNCGTVKMWFKKGVGILKSDYDISVSSFYDKQYKDSLIGYHIEQ